MHYLIPITVNGVFSSVKGKTPLSALNALPRTRNGNTHPYANAYLINDDGTSVQGFISREGRAASFIAGD